MPPARVAADFGGLLRALRTGGVDFIVVGGVAGARSRPRTGHVRPGCRLRAHPDEPEDLLSDPAAVEAYGVTCRFLSLDRLIAVKRAAGRPKDLEAVAELEALREERDRS